MLERVPRPIRSIAPKFKFYKRQTLRFWTITLNVAFIIFALIGYVTVIYRGPRSASPTLLSDISPGMLFADIFFFGIAALAALIAVIVIILNTIYSTKVIGRTENSRVAVGTILVVLNIVFDLIYIFIIELLWRQIQFPQGN